MQNEAVLSIITKQYNASEDINMQIVGANGTNDFALRVAYPRAPFDALGTLNNKLVYPNDEIELNPQAYSAFHFETLGYQKERMFITGLNSQTTGEVMAFVRSAKAVGSFSQINDWLEQGWPIARLETNLSASEVVTGTKAKITTPKGSFIISIVKE